MRASLQKLIDENKESAGTNWNRFIGNKTRVKANGLLWLSFVHCWLLLPFFLVDKYISALLLCVSDVCLRYVKMMCVTFFTVAPPDFISKSW